MSVKPPSMADIEEFSAEVCRCCGLLHLRGELRRCPRCQRGFCASGSCLSPSGVCWSCLEEHQDAMREPNRLGCPADRPADVPRLRSACDAGGSQLPALRLRRDGKPPPSAGDVTQQRPADPADASALSAERWPVGRCCQCGDLADSSAQKCPACGRPLCEVCAGMSDHAKECAWSAALASSRQGRTPYAHG